MNTKYGKLISRDRQGNLTAVYPEILCDDEVDFESRTSTYPVTNIGVANAIDNGVSRANTSIKNAFTSPAGGLGWDDTAKKGYVDFSGMSATKLKDLINAFLKNNSAVIADSNGKLDVDFSKLTADQVLALFIANGGVVKDSSGKLKIDFSKMTADQVLALFLANSGIIKDSSSGKLKVDFSKLTADQVLELFLANSGIAKDSSSGKLTVDFSKMTADQVLALFLANGGVVKDSSGKLKIDFSKLTVNDILALSSTTGGLVASSESGTNNGKIAVDFSKAPSYSGATSSKAGTPGFVPAASSAQKDMFLKGDGTWSDGGFAHLAGTETFTGSKTFGAGLFGKTVAVSASSIDLSLGTVFTKTISAATTFTFTSVPSGAASTFNLILTNGGSKIITWPSNVKWTDGTPPSLSTSGIDVLTFLTPNGGTTWYGCLALNGAA